MIIITFQKLLHRTFGLHKDDTHNYQGLREEPGMGVAEVKTQSLYSNVQRGKKKNLFI